MRICPLLIVRFSVAAMLGAGTLAAQGTPVTDNAPKGTHPVRFEWSHFAPMRDGLKLSADWYFPADLTGRLPTVLIRTPYNKKAFRLEKGVANTKAQDHTNSGFARASKASQAGTD